ncbi:MAG: ATP-binding cassette domain-containing protein [Bacteroidota bacterium]
MNNDNSLNIEIKSSDIDGNNIVSDFDYKFISTCSYVLLGRNGAGKTTLFRMIAGLENRFKGTVQLNGKIIKKPSKRIQLVFQDNRLLPWKTVYQNLKFIKPDISRDLAARYLETLNLDRKIDSFPKNLSGGEESRASLLLTFLFPPNVLLLDEPFSGLDIYSLRTAINAIKDLKVKHPSTLLLLVTHNLLTAYELADKILILDDETLHINKIVEKSEVSTIKELENIYNEFHNSRP